jgi:predicted NBD/HSP70 family sugar kinase
VTARHLGVDIGGTNCKLALLETAGDRAGRPPRLLATTTVPTGSGDPGEVVERVAAAAAGLLAGHGPVAGAVVGRLAVGIANLVTVLWPERVVVGGGVAAAGERLFGPLRRAVVAAAPLVDPAAYEIVPAALGPAAGAIGAALWARERAATGPGPVTGGCGPRR